MEHCVYANTAERANMTEWKEYTGSDEQITEMETAPNGWICRFGPSESNIHKGSPHICVNVRALTHYFIIPDDPLRYMRVRQSMTGQPVWWRSTEGGGAGLCHEFMPPFAHPDKFEYSFTEFKEEV